MFLQEAIEYIIELNYGGLMKAQKDVNKLFPQFFARVKAVSGKGGVKLDSMKPNLWHFKIHSGTDSGKWYDAYLYFNNVEKHLYKLAGDPKHWKKDKSGLDLRAIANKLLYLVDLQTVCSCPADLYWGKQYIRTQDHAKFTQPETVLANSMKNIPPTKHAFSLPVISSSPSLVLLVLQ